MVRAIGQTLTDPDIRLAILFGSQVSGRIHAGSDADVAVALDGEMSPSRRGELSAKLAEVLGCEVDVADLPYGPGRIFGADRLGRGSHGKAGRILPGRTRHQGSGVHGGYAANGAPGAQRQGEEKPEWMKFSLLTR